MEQYIPIKFEGTRGAVLRVIEKIPLPFEVEIKPYKSGRSAKQNSLYWKWLTEISQQMAVPDEHGEMTKLTKEDWHDLCRMKWIGVKTINLQGKEFPRPSKSTTKLKVGEFAEYLTKIEAHFLEKGVALTFTDDYEEALGK